MIANTLLNISTLSLANDNCIQLIDVAATGQGTGPDRP
jgi:hypothetical protein